MKRLFALLFCFVTAAAMAQLPPMLRNQWTTNTPAAASNVTAQVVLDIAAPPTNFLNAVGGTGGSINGGALTNLVGTNIIGTLPSTLNNVLTIDNIDGNDTAAAAQPYRLPWRTCFDIWDTNLWSPRGAIAASKPGDTIYFRPSSNAYYVPYIPLSIWGTNQKGLNLIIPEGATVVRTNFANTNGSQYVANEAGAAFTLIMPGNNSRVIVDGQAVATNGGGVSGTDCVIGWNTGASRLAGIPTNYPATNVYIGGNGTLRGSYDVIVMQGANNYPLGTAQIENLFVWGNYDCINNTYCNYTTARLRVYSDGTFGGGNSDARALTLNDGYYQDSASTFIALGGTNTGNATCAVDLSQTSPTNVGLFNGSTFEVRTNAAIGFYSGISPIRYVSFCGTLSGNWTEVTPTNHLSVMTVPVKQTTSFVADTNRITASGAGSSVANLTYYWNAVIGSYTNANNNVSNQTGNYWVIRAGPGGSPASRYDSTTGPLGPYSVTNTGVAPAPTVVFPTNTTPTRTAL